MSNIKYIRTADEIIYVGDLVKDEYGNYCKAETIETDMEIDGKYILKEANTVPELCVRFFLEGVTGYPIKYNKLHTAKKAKELILLYNDLYGAIHVRGKGWIYKAKMNNEGVLELL